MYNLTAPTPKPGLLAKENRIVCEPSLGMGKARAGFLLRVTIPASWSPRGIGRQVASLWGSRPGPRERNAATAAEHLSPCLATCRRAGSSRCEAWGP